MTEKELSKYYWLQQERKDIENQLQELGYGVGSPTINNDIKGINNPVNQIELIAIKRNEIINLLIENRLSALEEYFKIETYINTIENTEIRVIMRKRFLQLKTWEQIGKELHSHRTTVYKKIREYLKEIE